MEQIKFNEIFKKRTKQLALSIMKFYAGLPKKDEIRIIGKQLIRSTTSVAANFRAVCIARSIRERYSKFCIVVEEADETIFWLELLEESHLKIKIPIFIKNEALEISKVMSSCKKGLKAKL
jgi:four helix bundle protein